MYMYLLFETSPGWLPGWRGFFFNSIWWGALSSNVFTICAVYWSLGRRGYFGVSNGVLVMFSVRSSVELSRPVVVHCRGHFTHLPICPIWACSWAKNLSNLPQIGSRLCGSYTSETAGWIYPIESFMDLSRPVVVQRHSYLPICTILQKLVKSGSTLARLCGTHIFETAGWICTIRSSMELSRPVVVQHQGHLTLTLDLYAQILKMLYFRNGRADWHGTKGIWVDMMLDPHCDFELWTHPWPWPLIFKVKFWKSRNSGMGCPIDMEWKGCESTECWTHVMTFNFDLTHDLDLEFSTSNFEIAVSQEWQGPSTWSERDMSRYRVFYLLCDLELWPWPWIFKVKF